MIAARKDILILMHLRQNARRSMTEIHRETGIPISTVFDRINRLEQGTICRYTSLLDYQRLGYGILIDYALKVNEKEREPLRSFLCEHEKVNSLFRLGNDFDFFVEAVFRNIKELEEFNQSLARFRIEKKKECFVIEELSRERFLGVEHDLALLCNPMNCPQ